MPYVGRDSYVMIGEESTWGTPVARTHSFRLVSETLRREVVKVERGVLAEASGSGNIRSHYRQVDRVSGDIVILAGYEGQGILWKHALWSSSTGAPSGGIYPHTFVLAANPPTGGLTIEIIRGNAATSFVFEGCRITKMVAELTAGGLMRITLSIVGETSTINATPSTPTVTTNELDLRHDQAGTISWNAQTYTARMLRVEVDNMFAERQLLGSLLTKEPKVGGFRKVTVTAETELENDNLQSGYTADTESDLAVTITGTGSRSVVLTLHNAYIDDNAAPMQQVGVVPETTTWRGQSDGTDEGFKALISNTQSSATAA